MQAQLNEILEEAKAQLNEASTLAQTDDIRVRDPREVRASLLRYSEEWEDCRPRGKKNYRSDGKQGQSRS